ncbi:unnamed protein product [Cylicocyclus nassatus]|uniref:Uncharacterized protein n=1 Tax=Cylicocyclus nassatus TaxID=53992 RepID=A0AA36HH69_CYLNA|nr:unnamed protein product [Cylicocyclus nassatus]
MSVRPYQGGRFEELGQEEAHTIETFERRVGGTPHSEPRRQYSSQEYTERRTYGRDENGDVVVKIEKNPSEPIRPVSPVRPVTPVGDHRHGHLLKPIQPINIPRIDVHSASPSNSPRHRGSSPRSQYAASPSHSANISPRSISFSPRSNSSIGSNGVPMKKIIKKSRWVSIHDGRPVSPYTETITYEPAFPDRYSSASARSGRSGVSSNSLSPRLRRESDGSCAYIMQNPLYRD